MKTEEIISKIYSSEIPCRIEWMFDAGFTWSIQNGKYPRLWIDDNTQGAIKIIAETTESTLNRLSALPEMDWIERGNAETFEEAVLQLAGQISYHFPESDFSKWYNQNKI